MATKYDLFVSNVMASLRCLCCSQTHTKVVVPDQRIVCVIVPRLDPSTFAFFNDERLSVYRRNCKKLTKGYMIGSTHHADMILIWRPSVAIQSRLKCIASKRTLYMNMLGGYVSLQTICKILPLQTNIWNEIQQLVEITQESDSHSILKLPK